MTRAIFALIAVLAMAAPMTLAQTNATDQDFNRLYQMRQARLMFDRGEYAEAQQAWEALAESAPDEAAREQNRAEVAIAMGYQKQYDSAMKLAESITDRALADYTRMRIMHGCERTDELIATFADTDLAAWPESLSYLGFWERATAYQAITIHRTTPLSSAITRWQRETGDAPEALERTRKAAADYEQSARRAADAPAFQVEAWNTTGIAFEAIGETTRALDAYLATLDVMRKHRLRERLVSQWLQASLAAANIRAEQGKHDQALQLLDDLPGRTALSWRRRMLERAGDLLASLGRTDEARARYTACLELTDARLVELGRREEANTAIEERQRTRYRDKLDALGK